MKNNIVTNALVTVVVLLVCFAARSPAAAHVPAIYVFGDSLVDVGNNDFLPPPAPRAHVPYGIDLPRSNVTGRFTNGYNLADILAQHVGFRMSPPAYLSLTPSATWKLLLTCKGGANYASGGSGILDTTGNGSLTLRKQIEYFKGTTKRMTCRGRPWGPKYYLAESLFLVSAGGNDFSDFSIRQTAINEAPAYIASMVSTYIEQIITLYKLGARRVAILDVPPIGCIPGARAATNGGGCDDVANFMAQWFNDLLRIEMAAAVATSMPSLKYSIGSTYNVLSDIIANPLPAGIKEVKRACCGAGKLNGEVMCGMPNTSYCADRNAYVFWDKIHGTQATYERGILAIFDGSTEYAQPINFRELVETGASLVADI